MRKASFSVEKSTSHTIAHNTRKDAPKYLLGLKEGRENFYEEYYSFENFQELAEARYLEINKQKMQSSQKEALFEEALISMEEHHTKDDILKLFEALNKKYTGHTLINLAIHNDEGHFLKDGIEYYPTMHILEKKDSWYILDENDTEILEALKDKDFKPKEEDFKIKVNIKDFEKVYNYHAHAVFSKFDLKTGKSARFQKSTMSERYKFVAEQMKMKYAPQENRLVKKSIGQHKADLSATRNAKLVLKKELEQVHLEEKTILKKENSSLKGQNTKNKNEKEKLKEANKALEMQLKELNTQLQSQLSNREQHAMREALVRELKEELKAKTLTAEKMQTKFAELEEKLLNKEEKIEELEDEISKNDFFAKELEDENKALQEQNEVLEEKVSSLEEKINSRAIMSDYEDIKEDLEIVNESIGIFEEHYELPKTGNLTKLMQWVENKFSEFRKLLKQKDQEIAELKELVEELTPKQQKKESLNIVRELQSEAKRDGLDTKESDSSSLETKKEEVQEEEKTTKKRGYGRER